MKSLIYFITSLILLVSFSIFIFGERVKYKLPKNMDSLFTYHSIKSNKNYDNWLTAQRIHGEICLKSSYYLLPINIILLIIFYVFLEFENVVLYLTSSLLIIDLLVLEILRIKTEKQLKNL